MRPVFEGRNSTVDEKNGKANVIADSGCFVSLGRIGVNRKEANYGTPMRIRFLIKDYSLL